MTTIILDLSDLEVARSEYRSSAGRLRGVAASVRGRVGGTYLNYRDPAVRSADPKNACFRISRSIEDTAFQIDGDVRELDRIIGVTRVDLSRVWEPPAIWSGSAGLGSGGGGGGPWVWSGDRVREVLIQGSAVTVGLLKHLAKYQHWFGRGIEDYSSFLGYVDSAKSGLVASLLRAVDLTGDSAWQDLAGLGGKAIDLTVKGAEFLRGAPGVRWNQGLGAWADDAGRWLLRDSRKIPGAHKLTGGLGFLGLGVSTVSLWNEGSSAFGLWRQGRADEIDRWALAGSFVDCAASVAAVIPGGQGIALALTAVSLGIDVAEYCVEHRAEIRQAWGEFVADPVGTVNETLENAIDVGKNTLSKGWRAMSGMWSDD